MLTIVLMAILATVHLRNVQNQHNFLCKWRIPFRGIVPAEGKQLKEVLENTKTNRAVREGEEIGPVLDKSPARRTRIKSQIRGVSGKQEAENILALKHAPQASRH